MSHVSLCGGLIWKQLLLITTCRPGGIAGKLALCPELIFTPCYDRNTNPQGRDPYHCHVPRRGSHGQERPVSFLPKDAPHVLALPAKTSVLIFWTTQKVWRKGGVLAPFCSSFVRDDNLQRLLLDASGFQEKGGNECDGTLGLEQALPDSLTALDR